MSFAGIPTTIPPPVRRQADTGEPLVCAHLSEGGAKPAGVADTRTFLTAVVNGAIEGGELTVDTDVTPRVEMMAAVLWGMGFYAAVIRSYEQLEAATGQLRRLLVGNLWHISE